MFNPLVIEIWPAKVCLDRVAFEKNNAFHIRFSESKHFTDSPFESKVLDFNIEIWMFIFAEPDRMKLKC